MQKNILLVGANSTVAKKLTEEIKRRGDTPLAVSRHREEIAEDVAYYPADILDFNTPLPDIPVDLDGIVYFPGSLKLQPFNLMDIKQFREDMEVNFFGAVRAVQHYSKQLNKNSQTSIVFISTVAAGIGIPHHTSIASAKSAVEGFAKSLAAELSPKVRVNVVAPSLTKTHLSEKIICSEEKEETFANRHPLHMIGMPEDISSAIYFLLSEESKFITGQILRVDGGYSTLRVS